MSPDRGTAADTGNAEPRLLLLDLDGTLLDTAPDLGWSLNRLLAEEGHRPLPAEAIRPVVSHGSVGLLGLGFGVAPGEDRFEVLRRRLLELYAGHLAVGTRLFPGMAEALERLEAAGRGWGVVTNKPGALTGPLLQALGLSGRVRCVVSGDTCARSKPWPDPLLAACRQAGEPPGRCVYVGDARRDIEAARAVPMTAAIAGWGYLADRDAPETWGADRILEDPAELVSWMLGGDRPAGSGHR